MKNRLKRSVLMLAITVTLSATVWGCGSKVKESSNNMTSKTEETKTVEEATIDEKASKEAEAKKYYEMGRTYIYGLNGTEINLENAYNSFMKAQELGNADANFYLGLLYADYEYPKSDYDIAKKYFDACQNSEMNPYAQIYLSIMYYSGDGVDEDKEKAVLMLKNVIEQGYVDGCVASFIYEEDNSKYFEEYKKALDGKEQIYVSTAMKFIGESYYSGDGVEKNYEKAHEWFEKACDLGNPAATQDLAVMYYYGNGVEQSYEKALEYFEKASKLNNKNAMHTIGYMYDMGMGVEQDYNKAFEYYEKAANLGHLSAMNNLAYMYENGKGMEQNYEKAAEWYEKSAEKGNAMAMKNLSALYYTGKGVEQNYEKALELLYKAIDSGSLTKEQAIDAQNGINTIKKLMQ